MTPQEVKAECERIWQEPSCLLREHACRWRIADGYAAGWTVGKFKLTKGKKLTPRTTGRG